MDLYEAEALRTVRASYIPLIYVRRVSGEGSLRQNESFELPFVKGGQKTVIFLPLNSPQSPTIKESLNNSSVPVYGFRYSGTRGFLPQKKYPPFFEVNPIRSGVTPAAYYSQGATPNNKGGKTKTPHAHTRTARPIGRGMEAVPGTAGRRTAPSRCALARSCPCIGSALPPTRTRPLQGPACPRRWHRVKTRDVLSRAGQARSRTGEKLPRVVETVVSAEGGRRWAPTHLFPSKMVCMYENMRSKAPDPVAREVATQRQRAKNISYPSAGPGAFFQLVLYSPPLLV